MYGQYAVSIERVNVQIMKRKMESRRHTVLAHRLD